MYTFKASSLLSPDANEKHFQIWVKNQLQNYSGLTNVNIVKRFFVIIDLMESKI